MSSNFLQNNHDLLLFSLFLLTTQDVEQLAAEVSQLVHRLAQGVGPEPTLPDKIINTANGLPN